MKYFWLLLLSVSACLGASGIREPAFLGATRFTPTSGGVPAGNVWTITSSNLTTGGSAAVPIGNIGDIIIFIHGWEGAGTTLNYITNDLNGLATLRGTQVDGPGDTHVHIGTIVASSVLGVTAVPNFTGTPSFQTWVILRCTVSGTVTYGTSANNSGTGTSVSVGTYTTDTVNGLLIGFSGPDGSATHTSTQFGGQSATQYAISGSASIGASYYHTAQQSGANFTETLGTSRNWVSKILRLSAQ